MYAHLFFTRSTGIESRRAVAITTTGASSLVSAPCNPAHTIIQVLCRGQSKGEVIFHIKWHKITKDMHINSQK